jgi:hypothetical protein
VNGTFTFSAHGIGDQGTGVQVATVEHFNHLRSRDMREFFHGRCK